jgi:hypothetical protein
MVVWKSQVIGGARHLGAGGPNPRGTTGCKVAQLVGEVDWFAQTALLFEGR